MIFVILLALFLFLANASRTARIPLKQPKAPIQHHQDHFLASRRLLKPLLLRDRRVFNWVDNVVHEAIAVDEPDVLIIEKTLQVLGNYFFDRTMVAFLNRLLKMGRTKKLNWLINMLQRFARSNGIPMTQAWQTGLQVRKPSRPLPE